MNDGLYQTQGQGKTGRIIELQKDEHPFFSPDHSMALISTFKQQTLVNLNTGQSTIIWPKAGYNLCQFGWFNRKPLTLITVLLPEGSDPGYSCEHGSPVLMTLDGKLTIFDPTGSGLSGPDVSANEQAIAYDLGGKPWIYDWQNGARIFDAAAFGFPAIGEVSFTDPS
jgi:hypothetical protein